VRIPSNTGESTELPVDWSIFDHLHFVTASRGDPGFSGVSRRATEASQKGFEFRSNLFPLRFVPFVSNHLRWVGDISVYVFRVKAHQ